MELTDLTPEQKLAQETPEWFQEDTPEQPSPSRRLRPDIDQAIRDIEASGAAGARMTGSGSAVFGVYLHAGACRKAAQELAKAYPGCRMMRTAECGVLIEEE